MGSYLLVLDQATTSSRALLLDKAGRVAGSAQLEFKQTFPQLGWVEHNPIDIWSTQVGAALARSKSWFAG
jgi:glycerol kinase